MQPLLAADSLGSWVHETWGWSEPLAFSLAAIFHLALFCGFVGAAPLIFIWLERKVAGRIQDRLGPTRVGGKFGWLQTLADGIKLIQKEDLCPESADKFMFQVSPYVVFVSSFAAFIALPFADGMIAQNLDVGLFFLLAIMSLEVIGVILAGYSSGSKWALFGGMREAAQVVSYEIPMAICAVIGVVSAGSMNLIDVSRMQSGWFLNWLVFLNPFTFLAFFVYFTVATASVKRAPFDLAEAESELVAGFHTEYSGIRWSYFFMAEYASMFTVSGIATLLFLGGWNLGIPVEPVLRQAFGPGSAGGSEFAAWFVLGLFGAAVFTVKSCLLVFLQMWVRWTFPRLRIDQVMTTCLKYLLPISCALFLGAVAWPLVLLLGTGKNVLIGPSLGEMARPKPRPVATAPIVVPAPVERHGALGSDEVRR